MTDPSENKELDAPSSPSAETPETPPVRSPALKRRPVITLQPPLPENLWAEIVIAINYLTRLNLPLKEEPKPRHIRKAMTWFPLIGALVGIFGATVDWVMSQIGLPGIITATFAVVSMLWATSAVHEEEFANLANQYSRDLDKERKMGWLREERTVRYGTLAVVLTIIMKIGAIASLANNDLVFQGLVAAGCWSRTLMVITAAWLRPLQGDTVADHFQQPPALRVLVALVLGGFLTFVALGDYTGHAVAIGAGAGVLVALLGANYLRGYNGALLGTVQQIVELSVLGMILAVQ